MPSTTYSAISATGRRCPTALVAGTPVPANPQAITAAVAELAP